MHKINVKIDHNIIDTNWFFFFFFIGARHPLWYPFNNVEFFACLKNLWNARHTIQLQETKRDSVNSKRILLYIIYTAV